MFTKNQTKPKESKEAKGGWYRGGWCKWDRPAPPGGSPGPPQGPRAHGQRPGTPRMSPLGPMGQPMGPHEPQGFIFGVPGRCPWALGPWGPGGALGSPGGPWGALGGPGGHFYSAGPRESHKLETSQMPRGQCHLRGSLLGQFGFQIRILSEKLCFLIGSDPFFIDF